ncbi:MAG TPA: DUF6088 family protein [Myxococcota bacterium]|nr:DUF6088 family protein [Myxococcota bacterium]
MNESLEHQIVRRVRAKGAGCVFFAKDFCLLGTRSAIDTTLHRMAAAGTIKRIGCGLYTLPRFSSLLGRAVSPDPEVVAAAIARKFAWRIMTDGETALNMLGLTTQVPGRLIYLSSGPSRAFIIDGQTIQFRHVAMKDAGFRLRESALIVQALKALGETHATPVALAAIKRWLAPELRHKVATDTISVTGWVRIAIASICSGDNNGQDRVASGPPAG